MVSWSASKNLAVIPAHRIGIESGLELGREEEAQARDRPVLAARVADQAGERAVDVLFQLRRRAHLLLAEQVQDELRRPDALDRIIDVAQRLERGRGLLVPRLVDDALEREGERPCAPVLVDNDHLRVRVAQKLDRQRAEERALPRAGRADDEGVADVLDR